MNRILCPLLLALLPACADSAPTTPTSEAETKEPEHKDEEEHDEMPSRVRLPEDVLKAAGIATSKLSQGILPVTVDLAGELTFDPDAMAEVPARAPGRVVDVRFKEGDHVHAGALLAVIESPDLSRARAGLTAASARATAARRNASRLAELAKSGLSSGQESATADAEADALEAESEAARQALTAFGVGSEDKAAVASRLELRAPIDGVVLRRAVVRGQVVEGNTVVATVADLSRAYFLGRLFEKDLARVREGSKADVRLNAYADHLLPGTVETVGHEVDAAARTVVARIAVRDVSGKLRVGLFGTARVSTLESSEATPRLLVPASAVTRIGNRSIVFVKHPDGDFETHDVALGRSAEGMVEILSGLRDTEEVVTQGTFTIKSVLLKSTFGEDE